MVERMVRLKEEHELTYTAQCEVSGVAYSSFMRWKGRQEHREEACHRPGPRKLQPLPGAALEADLERLHHGRKRTQGVEALYRQYAQSLSWRELRAQVAAARQEVNRERRASQRQVLWLRPGLVWSMDDWKHGKGAAEPTLYVHNVMDLGSRYKFRPIVTGQLASGATVAAHLHSLFERYGPPLFLKRDNHGNLNEESVNRLLADAWVLPLNNPTYYAPYNGTIERFHREARQELRHRLGELSDPPAREQFPLLLEALLQELNHKPRPCLHGCTPCERFQSARHELQAYDRRQRKEVFECIQNLAARLLTNGHDRARLNAAAAWRLAAEIWLQHEGIIILRGRRRVLPDFLSKMSHK
jgi:hypothetical protein